MSSGHLFSDDRNGVKTVVPMTAYEIVATILSVASLMVASGMLVVAILAFLDKRNKRK